MTKFNLENIKKLIFLPLNDLIFKAQNTHKKYFKTTGDKLNTEHSVVIAIASTGPNNIVNRGTMISAPPNPT